MQKRVNQKNNKSETFTFDEYLKNFFPKVSSIKAYEFEEPSEMGISMARASLSRMQKILSHTKK